MKTSLELLLSPVGLLAGMWIVLALLAFRKGTRPLMRWLIWVSVAVFLVASTPLGANMALGVLERAARAEKVCGPPPSGSLIVVLAGGLNGYPTQPDDVSALTAASLRRLLSAVDLANATPDSTLAISGGWGRKVREADLMAKLAERLGFPKARIMIDRTSRTTRQSADHLAALVGRYPVGHSYLVTSADHMPRARLAFAQAGAHPCAWPVDFEALIFEPGAMFIPQIGALRKSSRALHEALGILYYRLTR